MDRRRALSRACVDGFDAAVLEQELDFTLC